MGYHSGSANDMGEVRAALVAACSSEGWAWNGSTEVLSKGAMYVRLQVVSGYLTLLGRTGPTTGSAPSIVRLGAITGSAVVYPLAYEVFVFEDEVYLIVCFSVDTYLWCAFGQSTIDGLPGTGMWLGATCGSSLGSQKITITPVSGGGNQAYAGTSAALFWANNVGSANALNYFVHHHMDGRGWDLTLATVPTLAVGISARAPLLSILPNSWNSEAVLLPLCAYAIRLSNKVSLCADLENARCTRIDNYSPGQIITLGADRWKIFPWYRKDSSARDGGSDIAHTGTMGWAIRYEGP